MKTVKYDIQKYRSVSNLYKKNDTEDIKMSSNLHYNNVQEMNSMQQNFLRRDSLSTEANNKDSVPCLKMTYIIG